MSGGRTRTSGQGRKKGVPNKATADVRATIALIAQRNILKFEGWLKRVARGDPDKAADLFLKAIEYHIPKLARTELTGKNGKDLVPPVVNVNFPVAATQPRVEMPKNTGKHSGR